MKLKQLLEKNGYHFDTGKSGEEGSTAEKQFNQHHASSMYGAHMGYPADKDTIDFDDSMKHKPGVQAYKRKDDKINKGYEPIEDVDGIEKMKEDKAGIENPLSEMSTNDVHFNELLKIYSRGGNLKKKISDYLFPNKPVQPSAMIAKELRGMGYDDVVELEKHLRIDIHKY